MKLSQRQLLKPSHTSKLYAPFKPPFKRSNIQPEISKASNIQKPSRIPQLSSLGPPAQPRSHLGDISNRIMPITYDDIRDNE
ncbi:403_t:CDS:1, partial [Racocetra persica]